MSRQQSLFLVDYHEMALTQINRPFSHTGVDFAGYFVVKTSKLRNASFKKCYVALFMCVTTRAIRLELVRDLSTVAFLDAIKNFVGRRGSSSHMYSENSTNFVGAANRLPDLFLDAKSEVSMEIGNLLIKENIQWHFNPVQAPHFAGVWLNPIKQIKLHLNKVLRGLKLRFEDFNTVLIQVEACEF